MSTRIHPQARTTPKIQKPGYRLPYDQAYKIMSTENKLITIRQAYIATLHFLEEYYERTKSDEIGGLLGGFLLLEDGMPADPAAWEDWLEAVEKMITENELLTVRQAYIAMIDFMEGYYDRMPSAELGGYLSRCELSSDGIPANPAAWSDWLAAIKKLSCE